MNSVFSIIGTRPQIIKSAILHKQFKKRKNFNHIIFDTGQHYDNKMFKNFINEYKLDLNDIIFLKCNTKNKKLFEISLEKKIKFYLNKFKPLISFVYGDTFSTLMAATVLKKNNLKVAHIESGARSFNHNMHEEKIRKKVDHIADYLFCCSKLCEKNLIREKVKRNRIYITGDILLDIFEENRKKIKKVKQKFNFLTLHRRENLNSKNRLNKLLNYVERESKLKIIFPVHPHTFKKLKLFNIKLDKQKFKIINPISHIKTLNYLNSSEVIFTDSGGVQRESYFLKKKNCDT